MTPSRAVKLFGTEAPPAETRLLTAGPLTLVLLLYRQSKDTDTDTKCTTCQLKKTKTKTQWLVR